MRADIASKNPVFYYTYYNIVWRLQLWQLPVDLCHLIKPMEPALTLLFGFPIFVEPTSQIGMALQSALYRIE